MAEKNSAAIRALIWCQQPRGGRIVFAICSLAPLLPPSYFKHFVRPTTVWRLFGTFDKYGTKQGSV